MFFSCSNKRLSVEKKYIYWTERSSSRTAQRREENKKNRICWTRKQPKDSGEEKKKSSLRAFLLRRSLRPDCRLATCVRVRRNWSILLVKHLQLARRKKVGYFAFSSLHATLLHCELHSIKFFSLSILVVSFGLQLMEGDDNCRSNHVYIPTDRHSWTKNETLFFSRMRARTRAKIDLIAGSRVSLSAGRLRCAI